MQNEWSEDYQVNDLAVRKNIPTFASAKLIKGNHHATYGKVFLCTNSTHVFSDSGNCSEHLA